MADLVRGKRIIYLYRIYDNRTSDTGTVLAFVTSNSRSVSANSDTTQTKDGPIKTAEDPDITISSTSYLPQGDELIDAYEDALLNGSLIEAWEANLDEPILTYSKTTDVAIDTSKTYYTRSGSDPNYVYTPVEEPTVADIGSYYEASPTGKYKGIYYQGYFTSFEKSSTAEDYVEITEEFTANGKGARGEVTVSAEQEEAANYVFADTTVVAGA